MYIYIAAVVFFLILFVVLIIFALPELSPVPYFPSNKKDLPLILKALSLKNGQTVIDLGAGDGVIIFEAAMMTYKKKLSTRFIAVELNPVLILIMNLRKSFHPNKKNIIIVQGDMFKINVKNILMTGGRVEGKRHAPKRSNDGRTAEGFNPLTRELVNPLTCYYLYISPWFMERVFYNIKKTCKHFTLVSYFYPLPPGIKRPTKKVKGIHDIYTYEQSPRHRS